MKAVKKMLNNSPRTMNGMYDLTHSEDSSREGGIFGSKLTPEQQQRSKEFDTQQKNFSSYNKHLKSQGKRAYDGRILFIS